jgi:predicted MFS family arabinose efflux permease
MAMLAYGLSVVLSQYALGVLGYTPIVFGLSQSAMPIAAVIGAYAGQAALARRGLRPVAVTALLLMAVGSFLLTGLSPDAGYLTTVLPGLVVFGLGLGIGPVVLASAALNGVTSADAGIASGINVAAFQIGGALGVAVVSTIIAVNSAAAPGPAGALAGFHAGMFACGGIGAAGVLVALSLLKNARRGRLAAVPRVH